MSARAFAEAYFAHHGAHVQDAAGRLAVALPPDLAAHFGRDALLLAFTPHDETGELVAPGSRVFDQMAAWLAGRGRMAALRLPEAAWPDPVPEAIAGHLTPLGAEDDARRYVVYDFLLAFLTDERAEHGLAVALDERGEPAPEALARIQAAQAEDDDAPALDPGAHRHVAEQRARAEAERMAAAVEAAAAGRLARTAGRLTAFYEALAEEVPVRRRKGRSPDADLAEAEEARAALRADLARRLAEEARRHQLRVQVRLLGQATLRIPGRRWTWRLTGPGDRARLVAARQDLADGTVAWPPCDRCGGVHARFGLCAEGHLACAGCLGHCHECGTARCHAELAPCASCGTSACPACMGACAGGHAVCRRHLRGCECCGIAYCEPCLVAHGPVR